MSSSRLFRSPVPHAKYRKIPVTSPGLIQLRKGFSVGKRKIFRQGSIILANVVWLHENNCCKGVVACLYQERGITAIMFCHQTGEPITLTVGLSVKGEYGVGILLSTARAQRPSHPSDTAAKHYSP